MIIEEHNRLRQEAWNLRQQGRIGIECPYCSSEMKETNPEIRLLTFPPQMRIVCYGCGYTTTVLS
jgi:transposase-like protein